MVTEFEKAHITHNSNHCRILFKSALLLHLHCTDSNNLVAVYHYIQHVVSVCDVRFDGMNIAIDTANGSASVCAKEPEKF